MDLKIAVPEQTVLTRPAQAALDLIQSMVIDSDEMFGEAGEELRRIKAKTKELDEQRDGLVRPLNETVKKINDLFRGPLRMLEQGEGALKSKMIGYQTEQERIAAEARRAAEAEARKERERIAAEAAAAQARAEAEATELRRQAAEAKAAGDTESAAALASTAESRTEAAAAVVMEAEVAVTAVHTAVVPAPARVSGIATRSTWKAEVTDKAKVVAFIAANPQFLNVLDVNQSALNQLAKAMKAELPIDGVRVYEERGMSARAA